MLRDFSLVGVNDVLCRKDDTVDGIQDDPDRIRAGIIRLLEKHDDILSDRNIAIRCRRVGVACVALGEDDRAHDWFDRAIETDPQQAAQVHFSAGMAHLRMDNDREARAHFRRALRHRPTDARSAVLSLLSYVPTTGETTIDRLKWIQSLVTEAGRVSAGQRGDVGW